MGVTMASSSTRRLNSISMLVPAVFDVLMKMKLCLKLTIVMHAVHCADGTVAEDAGLYPPQGCRADARD
jgi:hypothetical protein